MTEDMGQAIRAARERRGLSTQAVAEQAAISVGYLSKLEHGRVSTPSPRVLQRVAGVLDVSYWSLMRLAGYVPDDAEVPGGEPAAAPPAAGPATNERIVELLEALRADVAALRAGS
jgi:transcriptional regulator with XRE-family HTH domain